MVDLTFDVTVEVVIKSIRPFADFRRQIVDQVGCVASIDGEAVRTVKHLLLVNCWHT